nr:OprD family outer membrane porin [Acidithiobacillus ferrooxidans]
MASFQKHQRGVVVFIKNRIVIATVAVLCGVSVSAQAETLTDFFKQSKIDGQIRSYYFSRDYGATGPNTYNQDVFSLGGMLNIKTAPFLGGFGVGVSFFAAHGLGANDTSGGPAYPHLDATVMGPQSIDALGQAYLQYEIPKTLLIRAGDQELDTPWMNGSDSRMLPATYQGVFADISPYHDLHLYGMRIFRWKSRTSNSYYNDNLFYSANYEGDELYGGGTQLPTTAPSTSGTLAFGASYSLMGAKATAWYYDFYQFAKMFYATADYTLKTGTGVDPFVGAQYLREWGASLLSRQGVDATAWGVIGGVNYKTGMGDGTFSVAYNALAPQTGGFLNGGIVSPYTVGYATDPLYTTAMIRGLADNLGPGHGYKIKVAQHLDLMGQKFLAIAAFAHFTTYYNGSSSYPYFDLTYFPGGAFKGLSIRDRVELATGTSAQFGNGAGFNKGHSFIYNRVMLTYAF